MNVRVSALWRHPIKSHGREALQNVSLTAGQTMPWDRRWAVLHDNAKVEGNTWAPCNNFSRGAKAPELMAISCKSDPSNGTLSLSHPQRPDLMFNPDHNGADLVSWVRPLMPSTRAASAKIVRASQRGMTDTDYPSISLNNTASLRILSDHIGTDIPQACWRGNIWIDGLAAWAEFDWVGRDIRIGQATLHIHEAIGRCMATTVNPSSGAREYDTLGALRELTGATNFGVYATVTQSGNVTSGDSIEVL